MCQWNYVFVRGWRATTDKPLQRTGQRQPSLDGLRTISIALVLLGRVGGTQGFRYVELGIGDYANLGVVFLLHRRALGCRRSSYDGRISGTL
jgi:hypothetical protein